MKPEISVDAILDGLDGPFQVGKSYFFRLVTYHVIGRVTKLSGGFIFLEDASWIPNSGRFADFISGKIEADEVEPVGSWFVNSAAIADGGPWNNKLPNKQK